MPAWLSPSTSDGHFIPGGVRRGLKSMHVDIVILEVDIATLQRKRSAASDESSKILLLEASFTRTGKKRIRFFCIRPIFSIALAKKIGGIQKNRTDAKKRIHLLPVGVNQA
jgi:hypothetical protein